MSIGYIENYKPVSAVNIAPYIIKQFAAGLEGEIVRWSQHRSRIDIYNSDEDFIYQCHVVKAKCPCCNEYFIDITFLDNAGSASGCDECGALLEY